MKSFNIGAYRRIGASETLGKASANFFDPLNEEATKQREEFAKMALKDSAEFLYNGGQVAILDGTNSTVKRRLMIRTFFASADVASRLKVNLVFLESECHDEKLIDQNILNVKLRSPDYAHVAPQEAVKDFKQRIAHYQNAYEAVREEEGSFIKLIDAGKYVIGHMIRGYLPARILYFLMHIDLKKKAIFLTRHGESEFNVSGRIGGDGALSSSGKRYAKAMADWIIMQPEFYNREQGHMHIWCSTMKRTVQTANAFKKRIPNVKIYQWRALNEIDAGICEGKTYKQIESEMPNEFTARAKDKLSYRYPQGESYKDVIQRLEPVIFELERSTQPVLVIAHRAVLRCLYSYFMELPIQSIPHLDLNLHTVYKLSPGDYKTEVDRFTFGLMASKNNSDPSHQ
ncbi:6-phosphofructo-2-kinase/fructose-2,6-bisphosphatase short form [Reticulomyxa filosa]|uniref:6-phosphofructo-2-kinase/fructose-2, 6-bisphosphatase short form n=1 Tax=Reticulomyxa filosa TaxID=46433 RepID=X6MU60_RETFI|nr:6-phosphofructo-2-kinase/fructose-2,6-bisphosphatase short form [Reticulomyxa filosa]|eukprot:ETO17211.1 6-phosphofructo-2-kinase/fructose-2,6-bisphosphatase short form [Reticulomyxa filosa]